MSHEIIGTILEIYPEQQFARGFTKREFVVTTRDKYPEAIKLEFTKDKCSQLDKFQVGDPVKVAFNLRGNEYKNRYYVNLVAWKIEPEGASAANRSGNAPARQAAFYGEDPEDEQLPF
jgi:hypothetical protein